MLISCSLHVQFNWHTVYLYIYICVVKKRTSEEKQSYTHNNEIAKQYTMCHITSCTVVGISFTRIFDSDY